MQVTRQQVLAMAPDSRAAAAGQQLLGLPHWQELGHSTAALWGLCRGSALYQVKVEWASLGYHCSCPSRKLPCKHVLGLLLLWATTPAAVAAGEPPMWVGDWLARRREKAARQGEQLAPAPVKPVDDKARQRRAEQRDQRVQTGIESFERWLHDLVRNGLAGLETQPPAFWQAPAQRLVDAQLPGLAGHLARLATLPGSGPDWPEQLLPELGRFQLALLAWQRLDRLEAGLQEDLRQWLGWTVSQDVLERDGERLEDEWVVHGQWLDELARLRSQRTWLVGRHSGRSALILQFATPGQPFAEALVAGVEQAGTLVFYPGAACQRARFLRRDGDATPINRRLPGSATIDAYLATVAAQLARQPWLAAFGSVLHEVTLVVGERGWRVRDAIGDALPLTGGDYWPLLALSGGQPFDLCGEWDGHQLRPLGAWLDATFQVL